MTAATTAPAPNTAGILTPAASERAHAEGGDAVPDLIARDDTAGHGGLVVRELLLSEADRERQQGAAAEPGEKEGGHGSARGVVRERRDERPGRTGT